MKAKIAIVGSGNIGWALKQLLKDDYELVQGDITDGFDATDVSQVREFLKGSNAVISAGPFAVNKTVAKVASEENIGYFDLTEDVDTTEYIKSLKSSKISEILKNHPKSCQILPNPQKSFKIFQNHPKPSKIKKKP